MTKEKLSKLVMEFTNSLRENANIHHLAIKFVNDQIIFEMEESKSMLLQPTYLSKNVIVERVNAALDSIFYGLEISTAEIIIETNSINFSYIYITKEEQDEQKN